MSDSAFCEILVKRKCEGSLLAARVASLFGCFVFAALWSLLVLLLSFSPAIILLGISLLAVFVYISLKSTVVEYEYSIVNGSLYFSKITGKTRRREIFDIDIKRIDAFDDYTSELAEKYKYDGAKILNALSSSKVQDAKYVRFTDDGDTTYIFVFESNELMAKKLKTFNPRLAYKTFKNI